MDLPSSASQNPAVPRQRTSPANDHSSSPPPAQQQQQPYPYPVQQQQAGWTPSQPFYPSFYQNHQQPYPVHGHPAQGQIPQQNPYFDPAANAQFAQWAYHQMMYSAQQTHHFAHIPQMPTQGRGRSASASSPGEYFTPNAMTGYNVFPSGTPPPHPSQLPANFTPPNQGQRSVSANQSPVEVQPPFGGFHPYRRPQNRQGSHSGQDPEWRLPGAAPSQFQPPYARPDAAGSSSSVNSNSSNGGHRQRTNSLQASSGGGSAPQPPNHASSSGSTRSRNPAPAQISTSSAMPNGHARTSSNNSAASSATSSPTSGPSAPRPHHRNTSSSSTSSTPARPAPPSTTSSSSSHSTTAPVSRPMRPSPLSQGTYTAAEKRMSRDDSDLAAMLEQPGGTTLETRRGGIKGRLRRALSLNAQHTLKEEEEEDGESTKPGSSRPLRTSRSDIGPGDTSIGGDGDDAASNATVQTKKKRFVFNSRFNRSTDNISISSVSSSASVMIRKIGSLGKLARRNSLAGITSLFKDKKDKDEEESSGKKGKKKDKKGGKGEVSEASVSMATAELDRGDWGGADFTGLSPAAKLARQHTLKSNAEAEARAKAQAAAKQPDLANGELPTTWEKNTTNKQESTSHPSGSTIVGEDGTRVIVEDDDSASEDGTYEDHHGRPGYQVDGWDDPHPWGEEDEEEDITIRTALAKTNIDDVDDGGDVEPWAVHIRRSVERARIPTKGILKRKYTQESYLEGPLPTSLRTRSNSYNSRPTSSSELGPLARIPSPDPDHIDGLHRHGSQSSHHGTDGSPALKAESASLRSESPKLSPDGHGSLVHEKGLFSHPNSSAPALSTVFTNGPPTLQHRSATSPSKRLAFASNLSVYDTFPPSVYDRRSEPATWSRLTPALAQRIKEELNSYKMEEMEVHAASRIQYAILPTSFFIRGSLITAAQHAILCLIQSWTVTPIRAT
ncbi:hypothetical protein JAAARDRAFT_137702 [Jaapia argillacea MUCL 33604]|uniref:Uncharacterized protein n=1 Tax=Jaapia argillacea MUCL 33604 TaxID=933084 RepID=A0A067PP00_9AGAM|nr:hypothetical protein JAAARDRAFT_137702 [Jaapia argillacea MUCL 33604]